MNRRLAALLIVPSALVAPLALAPVAVTQPSGIGAKATLAGLAVQQAALTASGGAAEDGLGYMVTIDGDTALAGAAMIPAPTPTRAVPTSSGSTASPPSPRRRPSA